MFSRIWSTLALVVIVALAGCSSSGSIRNPPPSNGQLYVARGNLGTFFHFRAGDNGNVSPQSQLRVAPDAPIFLSLEITHDRLAAASFGTTSVLLLDNVSTGFSTPRIISGAATTMRGPQKVALDSATDTLYVLDNFSTILVFGPASTIAGNVAPLRTLTPATPTSFGGITIDSASNRLFVSDQSGNAIDVFDNASSLNGAVVPTRVISGAATQLNQPGALVLDSAGRLIVAALSAGTLLVFPNAATSSGNVAPSNVATLIVPPFAMAVSPSDELYVVDGNPAVSVYANIAAASGNISPARVITGPNTTLDPNLPATPALVLGVALDPTR